MVKKKTHIDFCHELKAQNLKVTVLGTYKDYNSKIDVRCDKCGCEWSPRAGSLFVRTWLSQVCRSQIEISCGVCERLKIPER